MEQKNDFGEGSVSSNILKMAVPMTLAQLINILYNVVDRMYLGHMDGDSSLALTGVGLTFPIITIISAFANLFGMGGAPLCSIARGTKDYERAESIMGNSFTLLFGSGVMLMVLGYLFRKPVLYLFGASDITYHYANDYICIYLAGTLFVMLGLGMNSFINSQGFAKTGMMTVLLGAVVNIILAPILIFACHLGVKGAALATVISQCLSAVWVLSFLTGKKAILKLRFCRMHLQARLVKEISALGSAGFVMAVTNGLVQIACNATLQSYGGDLYVGVMTVINSVREVLTMPVYGLTHGAQPVLGFNYGAEQYKRVKTGIVFMTVSCIIYTTIAWAATYFVPETLIRIFNSDEQLLAAGRAAMRIYFMGFFLMSLQFSGQSVFTALGKSKQAVFFSLLRKAIIVVPLTLLLPKIGTLGIDGVFWAEPISNLIGGMACFCTMVLTVWRKL